MAKKQVNMRLGSLAIKHLSYLQQRWGMSEAVVITVLLERAAYAETTIQAAEALTPSRRKHAINRAKIAAAAALSMFFDVPALPAPDERNQQPMPDEWDEI